MSEAENLIIQASCVAIGGRALAIEGAPGAGKSSLALALIDRGAQLIGDDAVTLNRMGDRIMASPPPNIEGKLELRGIGIIEMLVAQATPLSLILSLGQEYERLPKSLPTRDILGLSCPVLPFAPGEIAPALRAEWALALHGLPL